MSWDAYTNQLKAEDCVSEAVIFGSNGSIWTTTGISLSQDEIKAIDKGFEAKLMSSGIMVGGKKFMFLRCDGESMFGRQGQDGVTIYKTTQAYILSTYSEGMTSAANSMVVGKMADYLKSINY